MSSISSITCFVEPLLRILTRSSRVVLFLVLSLLNHKITHTHTQSTDPAASDVYSLGNLLFHVLTRRMPWGALEPEFANVSINNGNSSSNNNNMTADMANDTIKRPPRLSSKVVRQRKLLQGPNNSTLNASSSTPHIPPKFTQSNKTAERALVLAIQACYRHDPTSRPTSRELALSLARAMEIVEATRNRYDLLLSVSGKNNNNNDKDHLAEIFAKDYWTSRRQKY
jgi:serine/threonine protein kinase